MADKKSNTEGIYTPKFDTCFFERYAQIELSAVLGHEFDALVNMDRPDLQTPGDRVLGIEVTRAMEESKAAGLALLQDVAGITRGRPDEDVEWVLDSG